MSYKAIAASAAVGYIYSQSQVRKSKDSFKKYQQDRDDYFTNSGSNTSSKKENNQDFFKDIKERMDSATKRKAPASSEGLPGGKKALMTEKGDEDGSAEGSNLPILNIENEYRMQLKGGHASSHIKVAFEYTITGVLEWFLPQIFFSLMFTPPRARELFTKRMAAFDTWQIKNAKMRMINMTPYSESTGSDFKVNLIANQDSYNAMLSFNKSNTNATTVALYNKPAAAAGDLLKVDLSSFYALDTGNKSQYLLKSDTPIDDMLVRNGSYTSLYIKNDPSLSQQIPNYTFRQQAFGNKPIQFLGTYTSLSSPQVPKARDRNHLTYCSNNNPIEFNLPQMTSPQPICCYYVRQNGADATYTSLLSTSNGAVAGTTVTPFLPWNLFQQFTNNAPVGGIVGIDWGSTLNPHVETDLLQTNQPKMRGHENREYNAVSTGLKFQADGTTAINEVCTCIVEFEYDLEFGFNELHPLSTVIGTSDTGNYKFRVPPLRTYAGNGAQLNTANFVFNV